MPTASALLSTEPYCRLKAWLKDAETGVKPGTHVEIPMTLATTTRSGRPSARIVLWKGLSERGGVRFVTNYKSRKGHELLENPRSALVLHWPSSQRQLRIEGRARPWPLAECDAYWATRPRASQLGAWASRQSTKISGRPELLKRICEFEKRFSGRDVPRPAGWGGFEVIPDRIEFWEGKPDRLHDREVFTRSGQAWRKFRLAP